MPLATRWTFVNCRFIIIISIPCTQVIMTWTTIIACTIRRMLNAVLLILRSIYGNMGIMIFHRASWALSFDVWINKSFCACHHPSCLCLFLWSHFCIHHCLKQTISWCHLCLVRFITSLICACFEFWVTIKEDVSWWFELLLHCWWNHFKLIEHNLILPINKRCQTHGQ